MITTYFSSIFLFLLSSALAVSAKPSLFLKLSGAKEVNGVQNLKVTASLTNTGDVRLQLFNDPRTVLTNIPMNTFIITNDNGTNPAFTGIKAKYVRKVIIANGRPESFTILEPGQTYEVQHDLSQAYDFTVGGAGSYNLEARKKFHYLDPATNKSYAIIADTESNLVHRAVISGELVVKRTSYRKRSSRINRRANFVGCSAEQQSQILEGAAAAKTYAADSFSYIQGNSKTDRIKTWFGEFDQDRYNKLVQIFKNMNDNDFSSYDFDCTCNEADLFAYVYPEDWGTVHLCGAFWTAPVSGSNSKAGTIFHESTHFKENAGTDDNAYGQDACKELAKSDAKSAIMNADSYEYFVENDPKLK